MGFGFNDTQQEFRDCPGPQTLIVHKIGEVTRDHSEKRPSGEVKGDASTIKMHIYNLWSRMCLTLLGKVRFVLSRVLCICACPVEVFVIMRHHLLCIFLRGITAS